MKSSAIVSRLIYDRDEFVLGNFRYTFIAYVYVPCILPLQFQDIFRIFFILCIVISSYYMTFQLRTWFFNVLVIS